MIRSCLTIYSQPIDLHSANWIVLEAHMVSASTAVSGYILQAETSSGAWLTKNILTEIRRKSKRQNIIL